MKVVEMSTANSSKITCRNEDARSCNKKKIAILLLNLGGPDSLKGVKQFLFNLFYDKRIITLPNPFRWIIAKTISSFRNKAAQEIYSRIGGKSPLLQETLAQAKALEDFLGENLSDQNEFLVLACMRHFAPKIQDLLPAIKKFDPDKIILLPLYPQYSTTTTLSSIEESSKFLSGYNYEVEKLCCYFDDENFINAYADLIKQKNIDYSNTRILFSAHSLPQKIIDAGDPYQWQIEQSVARILKYLPPDLDYKITYQSKVGPAKWLTPSTQDVIESTASSKKNIAVVPISFVSEHVETLVELDIEYKHIAEKHNVNYIRVDSLRTHELFIRCLGDNIKKLLENPKFSRKCPDKFCMCFRSLNLM